MAILKRLLAKLRIFGSRKRRKGEEDASIYPIF